MASPVIKWAGGKRQLLPDILDAIGEVGGTYYEPFLGGGAVLLALAPKKAVANDINPAIVNLYTVVRDLPTDLLLWLKSHENGYNYLGTDDLRRKYYNNRRSEFNAEGGRRGIPGAARMVFLNKCGYNGLYRENSRGEFNTPWGHKTEVSLYNRKGLYEASKALKGTRLMCKDFEQACAGAGEGDTVFFDSPYDGTFDAYVGGGFSEEDHRRLAELFGRLTDKGAKCVLTNSDTPLMRELYGEYDIRTVGVRRMISCDAGRRTGTEIIVTNGVGE